MDDMNIHESYPAPQHPDGSDASNFTLGKDRLRTQFQQEDAKKWMDAAGKDAQTIDYLVKGR